MTSKEKKKVLNLMLDLTQIELNLEHDRAARSLVKNIKSIIKRLKAVAKLYSSSMFSGNAPIHVTRKMDLDMLASDLEEIIPNIQALLTDTSLSTESALWLSRKLNSRQFPKNVAFGRQVVDETIAFAQSLQPA